MIVRRLLLVSTFSLTAVGTSSAQVAATFGDFSSWKGVASPSEVVQSQSAFASVPLSDGPISMTNTRDTYLRGGAFYYRGDQAAGLGLLTSAATRGDGDAALTLGLAAEEAGTPEAAFGWYLQGASNGNNKALALVGRSQLYGVGTARDTTTAVDALLAAFRNGDNSAAADLAKASAFGWNDAIPIPTTTLWESALLAQELQPKVDYLRYLKAGGGIKRAGDPSTEAAVKAIIAGDPYWGPVASWDALDVEEREQDAFVVNALEASHKLGNVEATERLGQLWSLSESPEYRKIGLDYLFQAADRGNASAYTSIGRYYIRYPDTSLGVDYAVSSINTGLLMGDNNAYQAAAEYFISEGRPVAAYDAALLATITASQQAKLLAETTLDEACADPVAKCEEILVGYATSRQPDPNGGYTALPSDDFAPHFGFARVLVPTADAPIEEGFDWWKFTWNGILSFLDVQPTPSDPTERASIWVAPVSGQEGFEDALARRSEGGEAINNQVILYVHGVNTSFRGAITSAARLKVKANLPGLPIVYSWPSLSWFQSSGGAQMGAEYLADTATASRNCTAFQKFLVWFTKAIGAENLTMVAHSHGAELLENGLTTCKGAADTTERVAANPKIKSVIYAAPDVDRGVFEEIAPGVVGMAERVTMYASDADLALYIAGDVLSRFPRAGMGGANPTVVRGMETIDISNLSSRSLSPDGHGYVLTMGAVLDDLNEIILHGTDPEVRCLVKRKLQGKPEVYWQFREACAR